MDLLIATRSEASVSIEEASDSIHQIQTILTHMELMDQREPPVGRTLMEEAENALVLASSRFGLADYYRAREFARASRLLVKAAKIVLLIVLRPPDVIAVAKDHAKPKLAPRGEGIEERLSRIAHLLPRVYERERDAALPWEMRSQLQKLQTCGETLCVGARNTFRKGFGEDAFELIRAAEAVVTSVEHLRHGARSLDGAHSGTVRS